MILSDTERDVTCKNYVYTVNSNTKHYAVGEQCKMNHFLRLHTNTQWSYIVESYKSTTTQTESTVALAQQQQPEERATM